LLIPVSFGTRKKETADWFDFFGWLFSKPCVAARKMFSEASFSLWALRQEQVTQPLDRSWP
jgi:hypothetical protein